MRKNAIIFVAFKFKTYGINKAREKGYCSVLISEKPINKTFALFDEVFVAGKKLGKMEELAKEVSKKFSVKGVLTN